VQFKSVYYIIKITKRFELSLKKYFSKREFKSQEEDIQAVFDMLDKVSNYTKWKRIARKLIELEKSKKGNSLCKAYIPITQRKKSSLRGARLFLAINDIDKKIFILDIIPKNIIAKGSKKDISLKKKKDIFENF